MWAKGLFVSDMFHSAVRVTGDHLAEVAGDTTELLRKQKSIESATKV